MSNRTSAVVQAVKRRKRAVVNTVSVGAIGVLALGTLSTGVATAQDMVGSGDIQRDAVGSWQLKGANDGQTPAVGSRHIINETIQYWDMGENSVGPRVIGKNAVGPEEISPEAKDELEGEQGPEGPQGPPGVSGAHTEKPNDAIREVAPGETVTTTATCNEGESAIGGGHHIKDAKQQRLNNAVVTKSGPGPNDSYDGSMFGGYEVTVTNTGENGSFNVYPYVICAKVN